MINPGEEPIKLTPEAVARIKELQSWISDLQARADKAEDEDVREGFNLQISKLGLKVSRIRRGLSEELPIDEAVEAEDGPAPPKPTAEEAEAADKLVQRSMLEKRRGNKQAATDLLKEAARIAPGSVTVLEALGDDLAERKNYAGANEAYRAARRADPTNASVERKLAQLASHALSGLSIDDQLRAGLSDSPFINPGESVASPKTAATLSFFVPGLGQLVTGQTSKGLSILVLCLISIGLFIFLSSTFRAGGTMPSWAYFPLVLGVLVWIGGALDASLGAKKVEKREVSRPKPPVNMPFE